MSRCPRCGMECPEATPAREPVPVVSQAPSEIAPAAPPIAPNANAPVMTVPLTTAANVPSPASAPPIAVPTNTLPFRVNAWNSEPPTLTSQLPMGRTSVVPMEGQRRRALMSDEAAAAPPPDTIYMSPPDEVRRFPLFTPAQWKLVLAGLFLLALGLLLGYLVWSREKHDAGGVTVTPNATGQANPSDQSLLPQAAPTVDMSSASPTPELAPMVEGDQALYQEVKKVLAAYNPIYHSRYQVAVKDGVVTITGAADNQPEKDGVSNVIKMVAGIKDFKNNLTVKADAQAAAAGLPPANATSNQTSSLATSPMATPTTENNLANQQAALEAERQRLAREADAQRQREAEFQRFREEEQRRQRDGSERPRVAPVEATPAPAATVAAAPRTLRSGTVAWSGIVDGVDEIIITGSSASVRHRSGEAIREPRASFSAPVPRAPVIVKLLNQNGRGDLSIIQEPSAANGYTTIVRIDDTRENGGKPYQFTLRWTAE